MNFSSSPCVIFSLQCRFFYLMRPVTNAVTRLELVERAKPWVPQKSLTPTMVASFQKFYRQFCNFCDFFLKQYTMFSFFYAPIIHYSRVL